MQGQALLVTFCAIAKSDWPRAAMEREGGGREAPFSRPNDQAQDERGRIPLHSKFPLTLTLSREGRGDRTLRLAQRRQAAFEPFHPVIQPRQFTRKTPPQKPFAFITKPGPRRDAESEIGDQFFAERE